MSRLHLLDAHYALSIISNCISASKLMCTLRTSCCFGNDLLARFDIVVRNGLESVLNIQMSDMQWLQAYLPVREIGLDVRSVISLAPSAFLASALNTRSLQNEPIPHIASLSDADFDTCMAPWSEFSLRDLVTGVGADKHWIWDSMVVDKMKGHLFSLCETHLDTTRILAASALHAGDWLHVIPSANCGLFLKNKEMRIAVGVRLGAPACITYDCACGMTVDRLGLHCFSCKKCPGRYTRHSLLNDVVWRSFQRAKIQAKKEPAGLAVLIRKSDGAAALKRPDGASLIPWKRDRSVAWDVTVANTFAASYISATEVEAGFAAELKWKLQNMTKSPAIIFSFLWYVTWQVFGDPRRLISFMNSAIDFWPQQVTRGSHHFFFKDCQLRFRKVMQPVLSEHFPLWFLLTNICYHTSGFYIFIFLFILFLTMILSFFYILLTGPGV